MSAPSLCSALAIADSSTFLMMRGALLRAEGQDVERLVDRLAADQVGDQPALLGRQAHAAQRLLWFPCVSSLPSRAAGAATFLSRTSGP